MLKPCNIAVTPGKLVNIYIKLSMCPTVLIDKSRQVLLDGPRKVNQMFSTRTSID